jgi:hypothetical protein
VEAGGGLKTIEYNTKYIGPVGFNFIDVSHSNKAGWKDIQREVKSVENDWDNI